MDKVVNKVVIEYLFDPIAWIKARRPTIEIPSNIGANAIAACISTKHSNFIHLGAFGLAHFAGDDCYVITRRNRSCANVACALSVHVTIVCFPADGGMLGKPPVVSVLHPESDTSVTIRYYTGYFSEKWFCEKVTPELYQKSDVKQRWSLELIYHGKVCDQCLHLDIWQLLQNWLLDSTASTASPSQLPDDAFLLWITRNDTSSGSNDPGPSLGPSPKPTPRFQGTASLSLLTGPPASCIESPSRSSSAGFSAGKENLSPPSVSVSRRNDRSVPQCRRHSSSVACGCCEDELDHSSEERYKPLGPSRKFRKFK